MNLVFDNYVIVGAGGIGHYLAPILSKLLAFAKPGANLVIVDGDEIEDRNLSRVYEEADIGANKAQVLARTCLGQVPVGSLNITVNETYITPDTIDRFHRNWIKDGTVIFGCVDNHKTRKLLEDVTAELPNAVYVVGGNAYHDGQAQLYVRLDNKDITPRITSFAFDILDESDPQNRFPDEDDCTGEYEAQPQLILANVSAAITMLNLFYSQCVDVTPSAESVNEAMFDITKGGQVLPFRRKALPTKKLTTVQ